MYICGFLSECASSTICFCLDVMLIICKYVWFYSFKTHTNLPFSKHTFQTLYLIHLKRVYDIFNISLALWESVVGLRNHPRRHENVCNWQFFFHVVFKILQVHTNYNNKNPKYLLLFPQWFETVIFRCATRNRNFLLTFS